MGRSFETNKFLILRFFFSGGPQVAHELPVAPKAQVLFTPYNFWIYEVLSYFRSLLKMYVESAYETSIP